MSTLAAAWEVAQALGKAIYATGLLAIGVQMLRAQPGMQRAANNFSAALFAHAEALRADAVDEGKLDRIAADIEEIKKTRAVDPDILDRVLRALEQCEAERSGARTRAVRP